MALQLPIDDVLPALRAALRGSPRAVLSAPPGAGKSTRAPLALLGEEWLGVRRIILLEPRRLAARAVARQMARSLGEAAGGTVGYRVRHDHCVSARTRVEVVTEGIVTRMLQDDPTLDGVGCLIFDEFHERSLNGDLALALALHSQALVRPALRILLMSATLDERAVRQVLGDAPHVTSTGRSHPVETRYVAPRSGARLEDAVAAAVRRAVADERGSVLVFLPGAGEIRRVAERLDGALPAGVRVAPLYGDLSAAAQDEAIAPPAAGTRKIVLATPIAETSLTIEGVRVVVDAGLARAPRFSPRTGMTRLETVRVSRAGADQRRGRAGRVEAGVCYRLWNEHEQHALVAHAPAEITQSDLTSLALELAVAGVRDAKALRWSDPPPDAALARARLLLGELGALDARGDVTDHGREMAALPVHPRLAHMILRGTDWDAGQEACALAALLEERDFLRGSPGVAVPTDARLRVAMLRGAARIDRRGADGAMPPGVQVDHGVLHRVLTEARALGGLVHDSGVRSRNLPAGAGEDFVGRLLALAYPDRVGRRRGDRSSGRYVLRAGRGAALPEGDELGAAEFIVAAELDDAGRDSRVYLAAPLSAEDLEVLFANAIRDTVSTYWDDATEGVRVRRQRALGEIVLQETSTPAEPGPAASALLTEAVRAGGLVTLGWSDAARRLRDRIAFVASRSSGWPDVSDAALLASLERWLLPPGGARSLVELRAQDPVARVLRLLDHRQRRELDQRAPAQYVAPTGTRVTISYQDPAAPVIAVRLQEMFGVAATPAVDGLPLTVQLLSPAGRPLQVTRDLPGFWRGSYAAVRREMRGRYPRHPWPEDPLAATPTRRARTRGE